MQRKRQRAYTLVEVLIALIIIAILVIVVLGWSGVGCTPEDADITRAVEAQGYREVALRERHSFGVTWHGCAPSDSFAYDADATNALGKRVTLTVCSGSSWNGKGVTVRTR